MLSTERFRELIDSYGANQQHWPSEYRRQMQEYLDANQEANAWLNEARSLDALLDSYMPEIPDLSQRILADAKPSLFDGLLAWLLPNSPRQWWRPALASAMPLVLGVAIGFTTPVATTTAHTESWEEQERAMLNPALGGLWDE